MTINNATQNNVDQKQPLLPELPHQTALGNATQTVVNSLKWAYSKLPSFPYAQIKNTVTSIGSLLWDPTSVAIEQIKLPPVDLTELMLPKPGADNS